MIPAISRRKALTGAAALGAAVPVLASCGEDSESSDPAGTSSESGSAAGPVATTEEIPEGGGAIFAEEQVVITQPAAGDFKGFTNICTHRGCPVSDVTSTINCKCHGSQYSIEDGSVVKGPATEGLAEMPLTVDGDQISLA